MSFSGFGADSSYGFVDQSIEVDGVPESAFETSARNSLVNVQNNIRSIGDQISRLAQSDPTQKTVSIMKSLLNESSTAIATVEGQFRQWRNAVDDVDASSMRRKLILPHLEATLSAEVQKLQRSQETVEAIEKQLDSSNSANPFSLMRPNDQETKRHHFSSQMIEFSPPSSPNADNDELTDLPLDQFLAKEKQLISPVGWQPPSSDQASYHSSSPYTASGQRSPNGLPSVTASNRIHHNQDSLGGQRSASGFAPLPPVTVGRNFYDHADDDVADDGDASANILIGVKNIVSSPSSTVTGGSGSPTSEEEGSRASRPSTVSSSNSTSSDNRVNRLPVPASLSTTTTDDFLDDDYLYSSHHNHHHHHHANTSSQGDTDAASPDEDEDDDQELSGLLSRGSARSASYLDGWHLTVDRPQHEDDLELYVSRERLRGVHRIKAQLSQISHVFRELAHLINEQQEDLDLIDSNMMNIKNATGSAVDELRRANILKQRARRRNFFMILLTLIVGAIVIFIYLLQSPASAPSTPTNPLGINPLVNPLANSPAHLLRQTQSQQLLHQPGDEVVVDQAQGRAVKDLDYSGLASNKRMAK